MRLKILASDGLSIMSFVGSVQRLSPAAPAAIFGAVQRVTKTPFRAIPTAALLNLDQLRLPNPINHPHHADQAAMNRTALTSFDCH